MICIIITSKDTENVIWKQEYNKNHDGAITILGIGMPKGIAMNV